MIAPSLAQALWLPLLLIRTSSGDYIIRLYKLHKLHTFKGVKKCRVFFLQELQTVLMGGRTISPPPPLISIHPTILRKISITDKALFGIWVGYNLKIKIRFI